MTRQRYRPAACLRSARAETQPRRVAALRARLDAVAERAARVDDINEIENLQGSYGYYTDKMLWDEVVDLFAEGGTLEIGPSGVYVGKDSIRRYLYSLSGGKQGPLKASSTSTCSCSRSSPCAGRHVGERRAGARSS